MCGLRDAARLSLSLCRALLGSARQYACRRRAALPRADPKLALPPQSADMMFVHVSPTPTSDWCDAAVPVSFRPPFDPFILYPHIRPGGARGHLLCSRGPDRRHRRFRSRCYPRTVPRAAGALDGILRECTALVSQNSYCLFYLTGVLRSPAPSAPPPTRPPSAPTTPLSTRCVQRGVPFAHGCSHICAI